MQCKIAKQNCRTKLPSINCKAIAMQWKIAKLHYKIVIQNCNGKLQYKIAMKNCNEKLQWKIAMKNCNEKLQWKIAIPNCKFKILNYKSKYELKIPIIFAI